MSTQDGEDDDQKNGELDPQNPREYLQKAAANMDDEYSNKKGSGSMQNYYGIAHTLREPVEEQPSLIVNGRLKQYQVRHFTMLPSLHTHVHAYIYYMYTYMYCTLLDFVSIHLLSSLLYEETSRGVHFQSCRLSELCLSKSLPGCLHFALQ